jgi:putative membrane protein
MRRATFARALLAMAVLAIAEPAPPARGQAAPGATLPHAPDAARFINFAFSSAALQARASEVASGKDTRPEVKRFAQEMVAFRAGHVQRLQAFAQERGLKLPAVNVFEHQMILENLEPLESLELSRRYAEITIQALEQELRAYRSAVQASDPALKRFAEDQLPQLGQRLEAAKTAFGAVKP